MATERVRFANTDPSTDAPLGKPAMKGPLMTCQPHPIRNLFKFPEHVLCSALLLCWAENAVAETTVMDTKAAFSGTCSDFGSPQTNLHSCDVNILYGHYSNGRATFTVQKTFSADDEKNDPTGEYQAGRRQVAIFSGSRDQQATAEEYTLFLDELSMLLQDTAGGGAIGKHDFPVSGSCYLRGDAEMRHIQKITCSAVAGSGANSATIRVDFVGSDTPVDVSYPFKSPSKSRGAAGIQQYDPTRPIGRFWIK
jgi:hypothetical protein